MMIKQNNKIPLPTIGEILREEFLEPFNLSAYAVAKGINVPTPRIQGLLHDRRKITVDISVRLGRFGGLSDRYFLNLQNDIDIRQAEENNDYDKIKKYQLT